jgi:4-amino-4-deoxy-L-arabinose transferase-like glycosyltransferase
MTTVALTPETLAGRRNRVFAASNERTLVSLCMSVAFIIRLFFVKYHYVINTDGVYYATLGRRLISGDFKGGLSTYWSPLYPLLVGVSSLWFTDLEFAGRFVSVVAGAVLVLPVYLLIREFYGRAAATVGVMLVVIYPDLIQASTLVMTESVYTLVFASALLVGWRALNGGGVWTHVSTGFLMGCCYLLKPEAAAYAGLFVVLALGTWLIEPDLRITAVTFNIVAFLLVFNVLFIPYVVYIHEKTGSWSISRKVVNNVTQNQPPFSLSADGDSTLWDQLYGDRGVVVPPRTSASSSSFSASSLTDRLESLRRRAGQSYRNLKTEVREMIPQELPYSFIILCVIGLFRSAWTRERTAQELYLSAFVGSTLLGYAVTVVDARYLLPLLPVFLCWLSHGVLEFESWVLLTLSHFNVSPPRPRALRMGLVTALMLVLVPSIVAYAGRSKWDDLPFEHKQAGLWMKGRSPASPLILASGPWAAFYAGGRHLYLPSESYSTVLSYARRKGVDYLVVGTRCLASGDSINNMAPGDCFRNSPLAFLLDKQQTPPGLQLLYFDEERPEDKILVFGLRTR